MVLSAFLQNTCSVVVYESIQQVHLQKLSKCQKWKYETKVEETALQNLMWTFFYNICYLDFY